MTGRLFEEKPPSHLVRQPGDARTACGMKDAYPCGWVRWAEVHALNYGRTFCPDCEYALAAGAWTS